MSVGFHRHSQFEVVGAADAQIGKPSSGPGTLDCNATYEKNIGFCPSDVDLGTISPRSLFRSLASTQPNVLIACAPCTGFSRTLNANHEVDDPRNSLVVKTGEFVRQFTPDIFLMENARELLKGNFTHHSTQLISNLKALGYSVSTEIHFLNRFGLPQRRERALIVAVRKGLRLRTLSDLWRGYAVAPAAITVRTAIGHLPPLCAGECHHEDEFHVAPSLTPLIKRRLECIPKNGGSWADLRTHPESEHLMTPAMKRYVEQGKLGSHPDVYGRMAWDKPSVTIKRECGHIGNGRYAHPTQTRLCSVREMALLQGFPSDFVFGGNSISNMYRHIGDAVPPIISFQLAGLCDWILSNNKPALETLLLKNTHLQSAHLVNREHQRSLEFADV